MSCIKLQKALKPSKTQGDYIELVLLVPTPLHFCSMMSQTQTKQSLEQKVQLLL